MKDEVIARALIDALILRQETRKHDISPGLRDALVAASIPAFITYEAAVAAAAGKGTEEESGDG